MKLHMQQDGTWLASGDGDLRPILVEAETREKARLGWEKVWGDQYAEAQTATALSMLSPERRESKEFDAMMLASEYRDYKGNF